MHESHSSSIVEHLAPSVLEERRAQWRAGSMAARMGYVQAAPASSDRRKLMDSEQHGSDFDDGEFGAPADSAAAHMAARASSDRRKLMASGQHGGDDDDGDFGAPAAPVHESHSSSIVEPNYHMLRQSSEDVGNKSLNEEESVESADEAMELYWRMVAEVKLIQSSSALGHGSWSSFCVHQGMGARDPALCQSRRLVFFLEWWNS